MKISWKYTDKMVSDLLKINTAKVIVDKCNLPVEIEDSLKKESLIKTVHYSTRIEGNNLNIKEVENVISSANVVKEHNAIEVKNYYNALMYCNKCIDKKIPLTEELIFKIHNLVVGRNVNSTKQYRDGQNAIKDSKTGYIVYLPPEYVDVSYLMEELVEWINSSMVISVPIPIIAGVAAYQFVTIHPFWNGNGRTSRLLATYILRLNNYDLNGFYVMEEFYNNDIQKYYNSLQMGLHHNYYFGRESADITTWLEYFISSMADAFEQVRHFVESLNIEKFNIVDSLDKRERWVASYIRNNKKIKAKDIALHFGISLNTANNWIKDWLKNDFIQKADEMQKRNIWYTLTDKYVEGLLAMDLNYL